MQICYTKLACKAVGVFCNANDDILGANGSAIFDVDTDITESRVRVENDIQERDMQVDFAFKMVATISALSFKEAFNERTWSKK